MLKLTMNPRKRSKRSRSLSPKALEYLKNHMDTDCKTSELKASFGDNLQALLRQEDSGQYACVDYLSITQWQTSVNQLLTNKRFHTRNSQTDSRIDEYCREQIVEWSFRVVDYFRIDREVVALSLSLLDRFLATCRCDRTSFKLAATTTLHLAVKLLYPCKLGDLGILSDLSRGEFDMRDVAEMEAHILRTLGWHMHPPTVISFASILLDSVFVDRSLNMSSADIDDLYDITSFFSELAVCDYFFVTMRPSSLALACILNALEGMFGQDNSVASHILAAAKQSNFWTNQDLNATRHRLWELYERSEECALHNTCDLIEEEKMGGGSGPMFVKSGSISTSPIGVVDKCMPIDVDDPIHSIRPKLLQSNDSW
jgi:hypothetical protein